MLQPQISPPGESFFSIERLQYYAETFGVPLLKNLLVALVIFFIGRLVARLISRTVEKLMARANVDESLRKFVKDLVYALLLAVVVIAALERLGVKTTAAIAIIGAAGLAVGLALQGTLGNFAAGVMVLLFKPYKIGDLVTIGDHTGVVQEIKIFVTVLHTPDNKQVLIPNSQATGGSITNFSSTGKLRVDLTIGIGYGDDIRKAREVIARAIDDVPGVLADPAPTIAVSELADSSVNFAVRPWATVANYWDVYFGTLEATKLALDEAGIEIPFPQRDVHVKTPESALGQSNAA